MRGSGPGAAAIGVHCYNKVMTCVELGEDESANSGGIARGAVGFRGGAVARRVTLADGGIAHAVEAREEC